MQRSKKPVLATKPTQSTTKLPFSTTKKPIKKPTKSTTPTPNIKDLQSQLQALNLRLQQEKTDYLSLQSQLTQAESSATERGGLRMKRLRDENEDLTERLEEEEAKTGRLELQLRDERELRRKRDGTEGFVVVWKNDPGVWMGGKVGTMAGGGGGSGGGKRKRDNEGTKGESRGEVNEDAIAKKKKKKENEMWVSALRRREGLVDEDDEEKELNEGMRIKIEERKIEQEKKEVEATTAITGTHAEEHAVRKGKNVALEYALRFAEWLAAKPQKLEKKIETSAVITNPDPEVMDCDEFFT